jgi:protein involved in polysaccharide export with SLBB domain
MFGSFAVCLVLAACTDVPKLPPATHAPPLQGTYLIQPGDTLDVRFDQNPELDEQPTVQPDGKISMLYAPSLEVAGHSMEEARAALTQAYAKELKQPGVEVAIKGPVTWRIYVGGEVTSPGGFTGTGPLPTLKQAIDRAGGILDSGDGEKVVLLRSQPGQTKKAYLMNFSSAAHGKTPAGDTQLAAYDTLFVPRTGVADVYKAYYQYFGQFIPGNIRAGYALSPTTTTTTTTPTTTTAPSTSAPASSSSP